MVYPRLQNLRLRQDDRGLFGVLLFVGDLRLTQVDCEQGVALDEPATAAPIPFADQDICNLDPRGHELRQSFQLLDGRALAAYDAQRPVDPELAQADNDAGADSEYDDRE
jgi:hypothetical protein